MRHRRQYLYALAFGVVGIIFCCETSRAQFPKTIDFEPQEPPAPSFFIGAEGGWMKNSQTGIIPLNCDCGVHNGNGDNVIGNSYIGALFIEFERNPYISFGMKMGLDYKSTSTSYSVEDSGIFVVYGQDSVSNGRFSFMRNVDVSTTYFFLAPYFKISPFGGGVYIQAAPEFGLLTSSRLTHTRELPNSQITLDNGQVISNVRFENGKNTETLQDGEIAGANKLRVALFLALGYDIPIFANFSLLPQAGYNLALTNMTNNAKDLNWKISSIMLTLGVKYGI